MPSPKKSSGNPVRKSQTVRLRPGEDAETLASPEGHPRGPQAGRVATVREPRMRHTVPNMKAAAAAEADASDLEVENGKLNEKIAELTLKLQMANLGSDNTISKEDFKVAKAEAQSHRRKLATVNDEMAKLKIFSSKLEGTIETLRDEKKNLIKVDAEKDQEIIDLKTKLEETAEASYKQSVLAQAAARDSDQRISDLEKNLRARDEQAKMLEGHGRAVTELQTKIECFEKEESNMKKELQGKISHLEKQNKEIEQQNTDISEKAKQAPENASKLQDEGRTIHINKQELEAETTTFTNHANAHTAYDELVGEVEAQNKELDAQLAAAVLELNNKNSLISHLQGKVEELESEVCELQSMKSAIPEGPTDPQIGVALQVNGLKEQLANANTDIYGKQLLIDDQQKKITELETETANIASRPGPELCHSPRYEIEQSNGEQKSFQHEASGTIESSTSSLSTSQPPAKIVINIDPVDRFNWIWLQKMRAALPTKVNVDIVGPDEHILEFKTKMNEHLADYEAQKAEISLLKTEVKKLEKNVLCNGSTQKNFDDTIAAKDFQYEIVSGALKEKGDRIMKLEEQLREKEEQLMTWEKEMQEVSED